MSSIIELTAHLAGVVKCRSWRAHPIPMLDTDSAQNSFNDPFGRIKYGVFSRNLLAFFAHSWLSRLMRLKCLDFQMQGTYLALPLFYFTL